MNTEECVLFSKAKAISNNICVSLRLAENMISLNDRDITVYSIIISEICDNTIQSEAIFLNISENKDFAIQIFDELYKNSVLPCCANEALEEIYEKIL